MLPSSTPQLCAALSWHKLHFEASIGLVIRPVLVLPGPAPLCHTGACVPMMILDVLPSELFPDQHSGGPLSDILNNLVHFIQDSGSDIQWSSVPPLSASCAASGGCIWAGTTQCIGRSCFVSMPAASNSSFAQFMANLLAASSRFLFDYIREPLI